MPADINQIKGWLSKGKTKGARYVIVCHDGFDMGDFPKYVKETERFWDICPPQFGTLSTISTTAHEVYDLNMDIDTQLQEFRAWHPPAKA